MSEEERLSHKEEVLLMTAPLPVLSSGLRGRVLQAADEACDRRSRGRRALGSALVAFGLVGWFTWFRPNSKGQGETTASSADLPPVPVEEGSGTGEPAPSGTRSRRDLIMAAMGDDWKMIEAEFRSREEFTRRVQVKSQM